MLTAFGHTLTVDQWAEHPMCYVNAAEIQRRIASGWSAERAISEPAKKKVPRPSTQKHSRFRGVTWHKGAWVAQIKHEQKLRQLGRFDSELEAARVYNQAAKTLHGPDAVLNEV